MAPLRWRFVATAAVAAGLPGLVVVQPAVASDIIHSGDSQAVRDASDDSGPFPSSSFFRSTMKQMEQLTKAMFGSQGFLSDPFASMDTMGGISGAAVKLSVVEGPEEKKCRVMLEFGPDASASNLRVTLNAEEHSVTASYSHQQRKVHDGSKSDAGVQSVSVSSSSISSSSSAVLPKRCVASLAAILGGVGGFMHNFETAEAHVPHKAMIIFPSTVMLHEGVEQGILPGSAVEAVMEGEKAKLLALSPQQQCLVAGFTFAECEKLGNKPPVRSEVPPVDSLRAIPLPLYEVSMSAIE